MQALLSLGLDGLVSEKNSKKNWVPVKKYVQNVCMYVLTFLDVEI